jgi:Uma2 family endonuclease
MLDSEERIKGVAMVSFMVTPRRWTREEYDQMVGAGILHEDEHVQLIEGEILQMTPQYRPHALAIQLTADCLRDVFGPGHTVQTQVPLALGERSEPEPDVAVIAGPARAYRDQHPTTALLVVEIADSSLTFDRLDKVRLYARHGIPEYWILNLAERCLEVYREPQPGEIQPGETQPGETQPGETEREAAAAEATTVIETRSPRFAQVLIVDEAGCISPLARPAASIALADLLP